MFDIWLVLAVVCVFFFFVLIGVAMDQASAEKRRAVRLLEAQVSGNATEQVNLREQEMAENFGTRVMVPIVARASRVARRVTPLDARDRLGRKIMLAGSPPGWDAERVLAFKVIFSIAGLVGGFMLMGVLHLAPFLRFVIIALLTFAGFVLP